MAADPVLAPSSDHGEVLAVTTLGVDWAAEMYADFADDFREASFEHIVSTSRTPGQLSGPLVKTTATYTCKALALGYARRFIDGTLVRVGDFRVIILRGSIAPVDEEDDIAIPAPVDSVTCVDPNGATVTTTIVALDAVTEAFITAQVRGPGL